MVDVLDRNCFSSTTSILPKWTNRRQYNNAPRSASEHVRNLSSEICSDDSESEIENRVRNAGRVHMSELLYYRACAGLVWCLLQIPNYPKLFNCQALHLPLDNQNVNSRAYNILGLRVLASITIISKALPFEICSK